MTDTSQRLQKILSTCGIASRRQAESLISAGRVSVNGHVVRELGAKADLTCDRIAVDGRAISAPPSKTCLLLHKPLDAICTRSDPQRRRTIYDLLPAVYQPLFSVGRLDYNSTGALLMTNDGDLANGLMHPRHHMAKTYDVWVSGHPDRHVLAEWRQGVLLEGVPTLPVEITVLSRTPDKSQLRLILREGRNRQIRRVAEQLGHPVLSLHRLAIAGISLGKLTPGQFRQLTRREMEGLWQATQVANTQNQPEKD